MSHEAIRDAVASALPHLASRFAGALRVRTLAQGWFPGHEILRAETVDPPGASLILARAADGAVSLLSGRLEALNQVARRDPPVGLAGREQAYAEDGDRWTAPYDVPPVVVGAWSELRWTATRLVGDEAARLAASVALHPPRVERDGAGVVVTEWVVEAFALIRRRLRVSADGTLARDDERVAEDLPLAAP